MVTQPTKPPCFSLHSLKSHGKIQLVSGCSDKACYLNLRNRHVLLIEGKVVADYDALGQLLVYREASSKIGLALKFL